MWYFRAIVARKKFHFYPKKTSSVEQANLRDMFNKAPKSVCTSAVLVPLTPCFLLHQLLHLCRLQKTQKGMLMTLNQQIKKTPKQNTPLISCKAQVLEQ
jgi:hypothetical protein